MKSVAFACLIVSAAALAISGKAIAQTTAPRAPDLAASDAQPARLEQVTVTASKRRQFLLDVPYAVTPISGADLRDRGVLDIQDLQSSVPSLAISQNGPGQSRIQLRGIGTLQGLPTVGVYLDELPLDFGAVQKSLDIPLVDMQSIEVLRGPQGTLYGASSLGGTVRFLTQAPKLGVTEFNVEGGVGKLSGAGGLSFHDSAVANLPFADGTAAVRLVVGTERIAGWIDNPTTGQNDINGAHRTYFRAKGLWKLGEQVNVSLLAYHSELRQDNDSYSDANQQFSFKVPTPTLDTASLVNAVVNADLGPVTLVSSTGFSERHLNTTFDLSGAVPVPGGAAYNDNGQIRTITQELRANSNFTGPINLTAGVYYSHQDTPAVAMIPQIHYLAAGSEQSNSRELALFGEGTYAITHDLSGTLGVRYFEDWRTKVQTSAPAQSATQKFTATSPKANLLWRYNPEGALYATVSKGFRSGGFNQFYDAPLTFGPETLWNYELGNRASLWDNKLQYDVSVYYTQYHNIQGYIISNAPFVHAITENTGKASGIGVDASGSLLLLKNLTFDAAASYVDITYDVDNLDRLRGDPLNYVPKKTASGALTYRYEWFQTGLPGMARIDYQFSSPYVVIARNQKPPTYSSQANRSLNLRVGVEMKRWQVYLEGRNLTNNYAILYPKLGAQIGDQRQTPRYVGVSARAQF